MIQITAPMSQITAPESQRAMDLIASNMRAVTVS